MKRVFVASSVLILVVSHTTSATSSAVEVNLYWPEIKGPHCDTYEGAIEKLEGSMMSLASDRCAQHGKHAPSMEQIHYELHTVTSEWQNYRRAIARNVNVNCPMDPRNF